jgi:hypothetical protein
VRLKKHRGVKNGAKSSKDRGLYQSGVLRPYRPVQRPLEASRVVRQILTSFGIS